MSDYVSVEELKHSQELTGFAFADYEITKAIPAASRAVDKITGRRFWADADTTSVRYYTPTYPGVVEIDDLITMGTVATDMNGDGVYETVWTTSDYVLAPLNAAADSRPYEELRVRQPYSRMVFPCWNASVQVTGRFGWSAIPEGVFIATTIIATKTVKRIRESPFPIVQIGDFAMRLAVNDPEVSVNLEPYIRGDRALAA